MKGNDTKMPRMEDILNLPVQDPGLAEFSAAHLNWVKVDGGRQGGDNIALIPYSRVNDFVKGESANAECPASFRVESRRKRTEGSVSKPRVDGYLEYTLYWCSYGPEDYRDTESGVGDGANVKPVSGKGSRPGRRHMMRGCVCHFTVKRLYTRPLLALIIYNQRNHVDKSGAACHGILDHDALGTRAMYAPRISEDLRQKVISMLYVGIPLDDIMKHHMGEVQRHGGPHNRDDFLTRNDVRNMERVIRNSSHELHGNDECSVKMWVQRHPKQVFYFHEKYGSEQCVLGIQTEWQLQQLIRHGHSSSVAFHSAFGLKKLKYPVCSLLVFDSSRNAIPVAWVIGSSDVGRNIHKWIVPLIERIRAKEPSWRPNAFLVDDPSFESSVIRETFQCRVLICLWHIRRAWLKSLLKKCSSFDVQREIFRHLGRILYYTRSTPNALDSVQEFMQIFVDQCTFMDYFRRQWLPKIELWVNCVRSLPVASLEPYSAIEAYHVRLKSKVLTTEHSGASQRVDWLIHTLTTGFHSLCWLDQYISDTGNFANLRDGSLTNSWYHAMHIPDDDVLLDEENLQLAKVISQEERSVMYTIWNPGSEFSFCNCSLSRSGSLCQHIVKVAILCKNRQVARPLLSAQVYRQILLNLLQNPPDDPLVLDHAILHASRLQQDIKGLEELSNSGLLQPLPTDANSQMLENLLVVPRTH